MSDDIDFMETLSRFLSKHRTHDQPLESVRATAKFLGVSAPQLSRLQTGVSPLTPKMARKFSVKLGKNDEEQRAICEELLGGTPSRRDRIAIGRSALRLQIEATHEPVQPDGRVR